MAGQDGLARAVRPAHTMFDGDTRVRAGHRARPLLAGTERRSPTPAGRRQLDRCTAAAADVFARAMVHALLAAHGLPGLPAYRDVWPGVADRRSHMSESEISPGASPVGWAACW